MPKQNQKGRSKGTPGGYVRIDGYMLDCDAWKALTPYAHDLYMALKRRHRNRGNGKTNNGYISMSRREASAQTGFSESAVGNAFLALIEKGFVKITRDSGFNMKDTRAREYALTEFSVGDKLPTKEFLKCPPEKQNTGLPNTPDGSAKHTREPNPKAQNSDKNALTGLPNTPVKHMNGSAKHTTSTNHSRGSAARDCLVIPQGDGPGKSNTRMEAPRGGIEQGGTNG